MSSAMSDLVREMRPPLCGGGRVGSAVMASPPVPTSSRGESAGSAALGRKNVKLVMRLVPPIQGRELRMRWTLGRAACVVEADLDGAGELP